MRLERFIGVKGLAIPCVTALMLTIASGVEAQSLDERPSGSPQSAPMETQKAVTPQGQGNSIPQPVETTGLEARPSLSQRFSVLEKLKQQPIQFTDVPRQNWAYEPISVLMQKYGCISGYPDGTFRGQQALTRNEFAAGLESCMTRIDKIMQERTANLVTREDLATLFRILSTIFENTPGTPQIPVPSPTQPPGSLPVPNTTP